jgi:hypothetical protein
MWDFCTTYFNIFRTNNFLPKSIGKELPEKRDSKVAVAFLRSPETFTGQCTGVLAV